VWSYFHASCRHDFQQCVILTFAKSVEIKSVHKNLAINTDRLYARYHSVSYFVLFYIVYVYIPTYTFLIFIAMYVYMYTYLFVCVRACVRVYVRGDWKVNG
jgi:hypothetical protein